jgi:hypothetical protein
MEINSGIQQTASPVMTQTFQPSIQFSPTVSVNDAQCSTTLGVSAVRELWKAIAALRTAFAAIPKAGGVLGVDDSASRRIASSDFVMQYDKTVSLFENEIIVIPQAIADQTKELLRIAQSEVLEALRYPDPFEPNASAVLGESGLTTFLDERRDNLKNFNLGTYKLQTLMREFLEGTAGTAGSAAPRL